MSEHDPREHDHGAHNPWAAPDDDLPWMAHLSALSDRDVDELLAGRVPDGAEELAPLAHIAGSLRARAAAEPVPPMSAELRSQLAAPVRPLEAWQRRRARVAAVAAAGALAAASVGAAAAENALPRPIQDAVSSAADLVGVEVPRAAERHSDAPSTQTPGGAVPADPAGPGAPAEPASPATPATPPATGADPGATHRGGGPPESVPSTVPATPSTGQPDATGAPANEAQGGSPAADGGGTATSGDPPDTTPSTQPPAPETRRRDASRPTAEDAPAATGKPASGDRQAAAGDG